MRVNSISAYQSRNTVKGSNVKRNLQKTSLKNEPSTDTVSFKGTMGKVSGGLIGAGIAGLTALTVITGGIAGVVVLAAAELGGAVAGAKVGEVLTGKEDDD